MESGKLTHPLKERVRKAQAGDVIEVVVELVDRGTDDMEPHRSRPERMRAIEEAFNRDANPVVVAIHGLGGQVTETFWIDQTVVARVPAAGVGALSRMDQVAALDVPHRISIEA